VTLTAVGVDVDAPTRTVAHRSARDATVAVGVGVGALDAEAVDGVELTTTARVHGWREDTIDVELDGVRRRHVMTARPATTGPAGEIDRLWVQMPTGTVELSVTPRFVIPGATHRAGGFTAPMPGKVLEVRVAPGDVVVAGQTLIVLEAMKMEHRMDAVDDGIVAAVHVSTGQQVAKDELLLTMAVGDDAGPGTDPARG
jgi:biotin carboxyl carrier protein